MQMVSPFNYCIRRLRFLRLPLLLQWLPQTLILLRILPSFVFTAVGGFFPPVAPPSPRAFDSMYFLGASPTNLLSSETCNFSLEPALPSVQSPIPPPAIKVRPCFRTPSPTADASRRRHMVRLKKLVITSTSSPPAFRIISALITLKIFT